MKRYRVTMLLTEEDGTRILALKSARLFLNEPEDAFAYQMTVKATELFRDAEFFAGIRPKFEKTA